MYPYRADNNCREDVDWCFIMHIASYMDLYCFWVNMDYVDVNWFSMSILLYKELMGCYVNVDCLLDVDLFGI